MSSLGALYSVTDTRRPKNDTEKCVVCLQVMDESDQLGSRLTSSYIDLKMPKPNWHADVEKPHQPTIGRLLDALMACAR